MKLDPHDARLTAHALGELPAARAEAVERLLHADPDAREAVDEVRAISEMLVFGFAAEAQPGLCATQRREIVSHRPSLLATESRAARLTALVLGELRPSQTRVIESLLAEDRVAGQVAEEIKRTAETVSRAFAAEPALGLTRAQRERIMLARPRVPVRGRMPRRVDGSDVQPMRPIEPDRRVGRMLAAAAAVAIVFALLWDPEPDRGAAVGRSAQRPAVAVRGAGNTSPLPPTPDPSAILQALLDREQARPVVASAPARIPPADKAPTAVEPDPAGQAAASDLVAESPPEDWRRHPAEITTPRSVALPTSRGVIAEHRDLILRAGSWLAISSRRERPEVPVFFDPRSTPMAVLPAHLGRTSFDLARQCLRDFAVLPPPAIVRVEEFVNHFEYEPAASTGGDFAIDVDAAACPWNERHQLVRVSVSAREIASAERPVARLTFLVRVAATPENDRAQLLLWQGFEAMLPRLRADDSIAIAVWGAAEGVVVEPCPASRPERIRRGLEQLRPLTPVPPGSAASAAAELVRRHAAPGALNRFIVVSDGPFDVPGWAGVASVAAALERENVAVNMAVLGPARPGFPVPPGPAGPESFHADSSADAARLFVREWTAPATPLAERCQIEVLFNPAQVHSWRPLGFASPAEPSSSLAAAGPWRHGRQSTAVYEVVPLGGPTSWREGPPDRFLREAERVVAAWEALRSETFVNVSVRYQKRVGSPASVASASLQSLGGDWRAASAEWRLAAAAAGYALVLKSSPEARGMSLPRLRELAGPAAQSDRFGLRRGFSVLLDQTEELASAASAARR